MRWAWASCLAFLLTAGPAAAGNLLIVDGEYRPVEDAEVSLIQPAPATDVLSKHLPALSKTRTSSDGDAGVAVPKLEGLVVVVDHPDYGPFSWGLPSAKTEARGEGIILRLEAGMSIKGVVTGEKGIKEGKICASWSEEFPGLVRQHTWKRCTSVKEDGRFELSGLGEAPVRVSISAEDHLPKVERASAGDLLEVQLQQGILITGAVQASGSPPVAGAEVRVRGGGSAFSAEDGTFSVAARRLPVEIEVEADGFAPGRFRLGKDKAGQAITLELEPVAQVAAAVVASGRRPVEELRVRIGKILEAGETVALETVELEEGELKLDLPSSGTYRLELSAAGYRRIRLDPFRAERGKLTDLGVLVLDEGSGIRGWLVDSRTGEGVEGALVAVRPAGTSVLSGMLAGDRPSTVSQDAGGFELAGLEEGRIEVRVEHADYPVGQWLVDLDGASVEDLGILELSPGVEVSGSIRDRRGEPRSGLVVRFLDPEAASLFPLAESWSSTEGFLEPIVLEPGSYRVRVAAERTLLDQIVEIPEADEHSLDLIVGGTALSGIVTRRGEPEGGGLLILTSAIDPAHHTGKILIRSQTGSPQGLGLPESRTTAEVGEDGRFFAAEAPAGAADVTYLGPTGETVQRRIQIPDQATAEIELEVAGQSLAGEVQDSRSGRQVPARVALYDVTGRLVGEGTTAQDGSFVLPDLDTGVFELEVVAEGFAAYHQPVEVCPACDPVVVSLDRAETGELAIQLFRPGGGPAFGVPTALLNGSGRTVRALPTGGRGQQTFQDLPAGQYFLVWNDPFAGTGVSSPLQVRPGEKASFEHTLEAGALVELACQEGSCSDRAVQMLALYTESGLEIGPYLSTASPSKRFSSDGRLILGRLAEGRYQLRLGLPGQFIEQTFGVVARLPVRLTFP